MKRLYLRNVGKYAVVNDEDYERVRRYNWYGYRSRKDKPGICYARATVNHRAGQVSTVHLHRLIAGAEPGESVTWRNRNRLDCRRENLVIANRSQIRAHGDSVRGYRNEYRGVQYRADERTYRAFLGVNYKNLSLGGFKTAEEAARAYDVAAYEVFGEFARLNFPQ